MRSNYNNKCAKYVRHTHTMRSALRVRGLCVRVISRKGRGAPVLSASTFNTESLKLLGVLKRALEPIVPLNTGFSLTVSADGRQLEMDMGVKGAYVFTADSSTERVRMQSPVVAYLLP